MNLLELAMREKIQNILECQEGDRFLNLNDKDCNKLVHKLMVELVYKNN